MSAAAIPEEVETKWTLTQREHDDLLLQSQVVAVTPQLNIYFDQDWLLADLGGTCRFRLTPGCLPEFTLKVPKSWDDEGTRTASELEKTLLEVFGSWSYHRRYFEIQEVQPEVQQMLRQLNLTILYLKGRMRNLRRTLQRKEGCFDLDRFRLPGGLVGYELEVEEPNAVIRRQLITTLRELVPNAKPSKKSKFQRFVEAVKTLEGL